MKRLNIKNLKIRSKLLIIYMVCVLLPIISTDAIILYTVNTTTKEKSDKEIQFLMERIEYNLNETIEGCIAFTTNLYTDQILANFLDKYYDSYMNYYNEYVKLLRYNSISYNYNNGRLFKVQIFADNNTILSGGKIATVDMIRESEWYKAFTEYDENIMLYTYYDESKRYATGSGTTRTISIIRRLDNYGDDSIEKILKIDINYNLMLMDVMNEKIEGDIYVRNDKFILFSNLSNENNMSPFASADAIDESAITYTRSFMTGKQVWEIVVLWEDTAFWSVVFANKGIIALVLINILVPSLLIYIMGKSITQRLSIVAAYMDRVKKEQFDEIVVESGEDEIGTLIRSYNHMVRRIRNLIEVVFKGKEEKQILELSKKQAELKAVQSQVNPHFLFNTLESIRMRSLIKGETETADIIGELAILFRKSMIWGSDFITIAEELSFVEKYINIQRYRFGDKIHYVTHIDEKCNSYILPKLTIGTFIENACIHGIESSVNSGEISLCINKVEEHLKIHIVDNGRGMDHDKLVYIRTMIDHADSKLLHEVKSTGMLNAFLRLKMFTEGKATFSITSEIDHGTQIILYIPLQYMEDNNRIMGVLKEEM